MDDDGNSLQPYSQDSAQAIKILYRCIKRPPMATRRLSSNPKGRVVYRPVKGSA